MRLFIGVLLNDKLKEKIFEIETKLSGEGIKLIPKENLHITLSFLGEVNNIDKIKERLRDLPSSKFKIKGAGVFPNINYIRIVWIGVEGGNNIIEELRRRNFDVNTVLHITIARIKRKPDKELIKKFINSVDYIGEFEGKAYLFQSLLMKPYPKYVKIYP